MNWSLYHKYGNYTKEGYFIVDHDKYDYYKQRPKLYRRKKIAAYMCMLIPFAGIVLLSILFEEMGLQP